jgi:hypothetical protein
VRCRALEFGLGGIESFVNISESREDFGVGICDVLVDLAVVVMILLN